MRGVTKRTGERGHPGSQRPRRVRTICVIPWPPTRADTLRTGEVQRYLAKDLLCALRLRSYGAEVASVHSFLARSGKWDQSPGRDGLLKAVRPVISSVPRAQYSVRCPRSELSRHKKR